MKSGLVFCGAVFLVMSQWAQASPYLEPEVRAHLSQTDSDAELSVVLVFENSLIDNLVTKNQISQKHLPTLRPTKSRLKALRRSLEAKTLEQIENFRSTHPWAREIQMRPLWILGGAATSLTKTQLQSILTLPNLKSVHWGARPYRFQPTEFKNDFVSANLADATYGLKKINLLQALHEYPNLKGTGVRVGVLDTGIKADHPDLIGRLKLYKNFSAAPEPTPADGFNHGTHTSGTIAGGSTSGVAIGVAPEADLMVARIFDSNGSSSREQILSAMQWVADPDGDPSTDDYAQVVNNSWSDDDPYTDREPELEPFCQIVKTWLALGIVPVFSAGNTGPRAGSVNLPGGCPGAFSVGATEQNDRLMNFSAAGPAMWKNIELAKPEACAPGFNILSASAGWGGGYTKMSGTSMAAPHVSGAFALLIQAHPNASVEQIIAAMAMGARDLGKPGQDMDFGWGRIDILKSLQILAKP